MGEKLTDAAYHRDRGLRELNVGLSTACSAAARAHLALSSLHMQRAKELGAELPKPPFTM